MRYIEQNLKHIAEDLEIMCLGDLHVGDSMCDYKLLDKQIDYVVDNPNVYVIGMGDMMNIALKDSKSDIYGAIAPQAEFVMAKKILGRIPSYKWLGYVGGNHEARTWRNAGIDINSFLCKELGIEDVYSPAQSVVKVKIKRTSYWIHIFHGSGGGGTKGAKVNKMERTASIIPNVDVSLTGHTHDSLYCPSVSYIVDKKHDKIKKHTTHCFNTGSALSYRGGYAEGMGMKPVVKGNAIITLKNVGNAEKYAHGRWRI